MNQDKAIWLASLNRTQHARWRAACSEWYDIYNPHIADAAGMHREQILFDMAQLWYGYRACAEIIVAELVNILSDDALRVLYGCLGIRPRPDILPPLSSHINRTQDPHWYNIDKVISELETTRTTSRSIHDLMHDRRLRPRHVRVLLGVPYGDLYQIRTAVVQAIRDFTYNPLCDSQQSIDESAVAIEAWRQGSRDTLATVGDVVGASLARIIVEYMWERHMPTPLMA
jgi:hypothetical protein